MKLFSLSETPYTPISHDPALKKQVLVPKNVLRSIWHISHIILSAGSRVSVHEHRDSSEVFYCIKGNVKFMINGKEIDLGSGQCLVVEPGEPHSIEVTPKETELVYFMVEGSSPS
jgi:mannose-6-phosphate isomerase-like protein (cupin superfamily)